MNNQHDQKVTLLVVDDEQLVLDLLSKGLKHFGFHVLCASDGQEAMKIINSERVNAALVDYSLPDLCGGELYDQIRAVDPKLPVMILTGHPNLETAVNLMKEGIRDYLSKPFSLREISARIRTVLKSVERESAEASRLDPDPGAAPVSEGYIFGNSRAMQAVEDQIRDLPRYPQTTVLISGPTGTGKTAVARRIHELTCGKSAPFVEIDCSTIPHELCESELFGHEKGAFTGAHSSKRGLFEAAGRGTAFLDEIGDLEPRLQVKFLRVLDGRQFKRVGGHSVLPMPARIIAATNRSLPEMVRDGRFREDLYFRLNVIELWMPALREREDDIPMLARHFLTHYAGLHRKNIAGFTAEALDALRKFDYPGNVRELRNIIERAVIQATTPEIQMSHLMWSCQGAISLTTTAFEISLDRPPALVESGPNPKSTLAELERSLLFDALTAAEGNKSKAAQMVGLSRTAFHRRLQKYNSAPSFRTSVAGHNGENGNRQIKHRSPVNNLGSLE